MSTDSDTISPNCIEDKLSLVSHDSFTRVKTTCLGLFEGQLVQTFLDDVVAIQVLDQRDNLVEECTNKGFDLKDCQ